jgi:hypothetical protein
MGRRSPASSSRTVAAKRNFQAGRHAVGEAEWFRGSWLLPDRQAAEANHQPQPGHQRVGSGAGGQQPTVAVAGHQDDPERLAIATPTKK